MASTKTSYRGKNWNEADSLKLIKARQFVMSNHDDDSDRAAILNDRIAARFLESSPDVTERSTESIKERWIKMVQSYTHICDYSAGRIQGSAGQPPWFSLGKYHQKKSLGKKVLIGEAVFKAMDEVLCTDSTSNSPCLIDANAENQSYEDLVDVLPPSPSDIREIDESSETGSFNSGRKMKDKAGKDENADDLLELSPSDIREIDESSETGSFNSGRKMKDKAGKDEKADDLLELMLKWMEADEKIKEERERRREREVTLQERAAARDDKLVEIMTKLANAIISKKLESR